MKKKIAVLLAAVVFAALPSAADAADKSAGLANPIVEYETYEDAKKALGFAPLYLPKITGYDLYYVSIVGGDLADLSYRRSGQPNTEIRVRTALASANRKDDISGIYTDKWTDYVVKKLPVKACKLSDKIFAAHWKSDGYLFSVQSEGISYTEFINLLENGLVDIAVHYYPVDKSTVNTNL